MEDLELFCCQNSSCSDYGLRGKGNIRLCFRYGPTKQRRMLACRTCQTRFSERKGTALFGSRLPHDQALNVFRHPQDGCGTRQTARLTGVDKDTVTRYALRAGNHARNSHDELVAFSPSTQEAQLDEKWSFVYKKQKQCNPTKPEDARCGDCWDHVALDPEHRLVLGVIVGKRTEENATQLVHELFERTDGRFINLISSDEYPAYATVIAKVYAEPEVVPTGKAPAERLPKDLVYATVHKTRENNRVVKVETRLVYGTMRNLTAALLWAVLNFVNTVFIERSNGTDRLNNSRKVRKSYRFSKDWGVHEAMSYFTLYSSNYCNTVRTLRVEVAPKKYRQQTPAMAAGLTDHVWSMEEWLLFPSTTRHKIPPFSRN